MIEVWDQDKVLKLYFNNCQDVASNLKVGKAEFLGRAIAKPQVFLQEDMVSVCSMILHQLSLSLVRKKINYIKLYFIIITIYWINFLSFTVSQQECYHPPKLEWLQIYRGAEEVFE